MADNRRLTRREKVAGAIGGAAVVGGMGAMLYAGLKQAQRGENEANRAARARIDRIRAQQKAYNANVERRIYGGTKSGVPQRAPAAARGSRVAAVARGTGRAAVATARGVATVARATGSVAGWAVRSATRDITGVKGVAGVATKAGRKEAVAGAKQAAQTAKATVGAVREARATGATLGQAARVGVSGGAQALGQAARLLSAFGGAGKLAAVGLSIGGAGYAAYKTYQKGRDANAARAADDVATAGLDALTAGGTRTFRERMAQGDSVITAAARGFATFIDRKLTMGAGQAAKNQIQMMLDQGKGDRAPGRQVSAPQAPTGLVAAIMAGRASGDAGRNTPLPPQPKEGTQVASKGDSKKPDKADRIAYVKVDGTTAQLTQKQAAAAKAARKSGPRTEGGALKAIG